MLRPILKFCIRRAEYIIYSSHQEAQNSYFFNKKYLCLKNCIRFDVNRTSDHTPRDKSKIIFISKIDWKYKGILELITAFEDFSKVHHAFELHIYGYGSNKTRAYEVDVRDKAINQLLKKISCKSNIKFHGAIYGEDKWSILKQAGALCLFSKSEAMPLILSEAISSERLCYLVKILTTHRLYKTTNFFVMGRVMKSQSYLIITLLIW